MQQIDAVYVFSTVGGVSLLFVLYIISSYNSAVRLVNIISEAHANIGVVRTKKKQLITKLIELASSYGRSEMDTMKSISSLFSASAGSEQATVAKLANLRMSFPDIRANQLYEEVLGELSIIECELAKSKERYNTVVRTFNTNLTTFPSNLILSCLGFKSVNYWDNETGDSL